LPAQPGWWLSLCFDPRFAAESSPAAITAAFNPGLFPYTPTSNVDDVRMARLTLRAQPGTNFFNPLSITQSRNLFKISDDLMYERPTDKTSPAQQLAIQRDDSFPVRRNFMADYEYIITMTPNLRGVPVGYNPAVPAQNPIAYGLGGVPIPNEPIPLDRPTEYTMSSVVFYKRQVALDAYIPGDSREPEAERISDVVAFSGSGYNGGDITIQTRTPLASALGNELEIHQGDWVLLSGNMYEATLPPNPRKFLGPQFHWYRVASVDGDSYPNATNTFHLRDLTLDGPDWPTLLVPNTQLTIVSGVVGVFSTQVQVE
jgi:hypothetical protein